MYMYCKPIYHNVISPLLLSLTQFPGLFVLSYLQHGSQNLHWICFLFRYIQCPNHMKSMDEFLSAELAMNSKSRAAASSGEWKLPNIPYEIIL